MHTSTKYGIKYKNLDPVLLQRLKKLTFLEVNFDF